MRLCSIASGSSGNCIYVGSEATHLLVDVGISGKKAEAGLNSLGLTGRDLDGILVTHEHMDHVAGLGVMARKYEVPIYATTGTLEEIQKMGNLGKIDIVLLPVIAGVSYEVLKLSGNSDNPVVNLLSKPGMAIQKMTTSEPDDGMIEVAIQAVEAVFDWRAYERDNFHTS